MSAQQTASEQLVYMFMNYWGGELKRSGQRVDAKALEGFREQGRELVAEVERRAAEKAYNEGHRAGIRWKRGTPSHNPYRRNEGEKE